MNLFCKFVLLLISTQKLGKETHVSHIVSLRHYLLNQLNIPAKMGSWWAGPCIRKLSSKVKSWVRRNCKNARVGGNSSCTRDWGAESTEKVRCQRTIWNQWPRACPEFVGVVCLLPHQTDLSNGSHSSIECLSDLAPSDWEATTLVENLSDFGQGQLSNFNSGGWANRCPSSQVLFIWL